MDWLLILLRLTHILSGALWLGMMMYNVAFLMPTLQDIGPGAAPVMAGLQRRKLMTVIPVLAVLTIVSGFWLMERVWGGIGGLMASRAGQTYAAGATLALLSFVVGIAVARPAMVRAGELAQSMGSLKTDEERAARGAELARLRARGTTVGQLVAVLLLLAAAAMAIARYVR